jgi:hypothetical protein
MLAVVVIAAWLDLINIASDGVNGTFCFPLITGAAASTVDAQSHRLADEYTDGYADGKDGDEEVVLHLVCVRILVGCVVYKINYGTILNAVGVEGRYLMSRCF